MSDDEFERKITKNRLKKETKNVAMTKADQEFKKLADRDGDEAQLAAGQELAKDETRIVGKAPRGSVDKELLGG
jgi:hypothetical protein